MDRLNAEAACRDRDRDGAFQGHCRPGTQYDTTAEAVAYPSRLAACDAQRWSAARPGTSRRGTPAWKEEARYEPGSERAIGSAEGRGSMH